MDQFNSPAATELSPRPVKKDLVSQIDDKLNAEDEVVPGDSQMLTCNSMWYVHAESLRHLVCSLFIGRRYKTVRLFKMARLIWTSSALNYSRKQNAQEAVQSSMRRISSLSSSRCFRQTSLVRSPSNERI